MSKQACHARVAASPPSIHPPPLLQGSFRGDGQHQHLLWLPFVKPLGYGGDTYQS